MTTTTLEQPNTMNKTAYKYSDLATLLTGLMEVENLKGVKFALKVSKNIRLIRSELTQLEEAAKPTPAFLEIAAEVQAIEADQSKSDEVKKLDIERLEKEEGNEEHINFRKEQIAEFQKMMEEETEISLFKLSENHLPADITAKQLNSISLIIK
jgi:Mg-chelatase subunit ChlI